MIKVCVVTGGRMDYGHLFKVMKLIKRSRKLDLKIIATCMHLSPEFGMTCNQIIKDGFKIDKKIECLLSSDSSKGIAKSVGLANISIADAYEEISPDIIMVMGDRFELLAAAQVALFMKIPIAHISGGDTTEGAYDESIRHSITKMSHIHFVTNKEAYQRVLQLGEDPNFIHNVGSPTIDYIMDTKLIPRNELEKKLNFKFQKRNILFTYHPVTLNNKKNLNDLKIILNALLNFKNLGIIITKSNADDGGRLLNEEIDKFTLKASNVIAFDALGQFLYYNCINNVDCVVGNSSSGLFEVPTFKKPTVNIGDRQKGRTRSKSIIDCNINESNIVDAINQSFILDCSHVKNPYGEGESSKKICKVLESIDFDNLSVQKHFHNFP